MIECKQEYNARDTWYNDHMKINIEANCDYTTPKIVDYVPKTSESSTTYTVGGGLSGKLGTGSGAEVGLEASMSASTVVDDITCSISSNEINDLSYYFYFTSKWIWKTSSRSQVKRKTMTIVEVDDYSKLQSSNDLISVTYTGGIWRNGFWSKELVTESYNYTFKIH